MSDFDEIITALEKDRRNVSNELKRLRAENEKLRAQVLGETMDLTAVSFDGFARGKDYAQAERERQKVQIDNLTAENEKLRAALKPFADKADHHTQGAYWMDAIFTVDECRAAAAALKETGDE